MSDFNNSGALYSTTTTNNTELDAFGNFELEHVYTSDGIHKYKRTVYNNNTSYWILGQPANTRIDTSDPGNQALRETKYSYYSGQPWRLQHEKQVHWIESTSVEYITTYGYDTYGNITSIQDPDPDHDQTTIDYSESNGMFANWTTNPLGHTIHRTFEPDFGTILTETDPNGQITEYDYDAFGRIDYISYPDGAYKDYYYHVVQNNHYVTVEASDQPTVTTYYDNFGRKKKEKTAATDGTIIYTETLYDNAGNISYESLPYYANETKYWTEYQYDPARWYLCKQVNPDGTDKDFTKNGLIETTTDENSHTKTTIKDSLGRIVEITEATNGVTGYAYDIFDNLLTVTDPLENVTTIKYDDLGRKISMDDPYMGDWEYDYDENGNLIYQKDNKGQETIMTYDGLNRIDYKTYNSDNIAIDYIYDEPVGGYYNIGYLTTIETIEGSDITSVVEYNYDKMGRQVNEKRNINSVDYEIDREYDLAGRIEYITYPDTGRTQYKYTYDPIGILREVRENGSAYPIADFIAYNALGQVGSISYRNGAGTEYYYYQDGSYRLEDLITTDGAGYEIQELHYEFDNVGNIETITDYQNSVSHSFFYDEINRLTDASATGGSDPDRLYDQTFTYDLAGNIEEKTGMGGYNVLEWEDSTKHIRPTAVSLDEEMTGVASRDIEYNQDNMPTQITYAGGTTTYLYYDGEGNRVKKL